MKSIVLFILAVLNYQNMNDLDKYYNVINAYKLKIGDHAVFTELNPFLDNFGIPDSLRIVNNVYKTKHKTDILNLITKSKNELPQLFYPSMSFLIVEGNYVIPNLIDLRNKKIKLFLNEICFSENYLLKDFKKDFPISYKNPVDKHSIFQTLKINIGYSTISSYFLTKWSIDDQNSRQFIELVFLDGKLGFIIFNNF